MTKYVIGYVVIGMLLFGWTYNHYSPHPRFFKCQEEAIQISHEQWCAEQGGKRMGTAFVTGLVWPAIAPMWVAIQITKW